MYSGKELPIPNPRPGTTRYERSGFEELLHLKHKKIKPKKPRLISYGTAEGGVYCDTREGVPMVGRRRRSLFSAAARRDSAPPY